MKVMIFVRGHLVGEAKIAFPLVDKAHDIEVNSDVVVAFVREHPGPDDRPLFLSGRTEQT